MIPVFIMSDRLGGMKLFRYRGKDRRGAEIQGVWEAPEESTVIKALQEEKSTVMYLRQMGLIESLIHRAGNKPYIKQDTGPKSTEGPQSRADSKQGEPAFKTGKVGKESIAQFTRQLAVLVRAGLSFDRALYIISNSEKKGSHLRGLILSLMAEVESGKSPAAAFSKYPELFSSEYTGLLTVGMEIGRLSDCLDTLADALEKESRLMKRVQAALTYPAFVFILTVLCNLLIFFYVFPQISEIINSMKVALPVCTRVMMMLFGLLTNPMVLLLICLTLLLVIYQIRSYVRTPVGRFNAGAAKYNMPVLGGLYRRIFIERFCRSMAMFFRYGVPLLSALKVVGEMFDDAYLHESFFSTIRTDLSAGEDFSEALRRTSMVPPVVQSLATVGTQTGDMASVLIRAADFYELDIDQNLQKAVSLLEPFLIIIMGAFIVFIIVSIFLPFYQAITTIGL